MSRVHSDISVTPDFSGLPASVISGLQHLANAAAGLVVVLAGLGIAVSVVGILVGSWSANPHLASARRWA